MIIKVYKYLSSINFHHWCPSPRPASTNSHLTINRNLLWSKCQLVYSTFEFHKERKKKQKQKAGFGLNSSNFQFMIQRFVSYWSLFPFSLLQQIFWDLMKLRVMKWSLDTGANNLQVITFAVTVQSNVFYSLSPTLIIKSIGNYWNFPNHYLTQAIWSYWKRKLRFWRFGFIFTQLHRHTYT